MKRVVFIKQFKMNAYFEYKPKEKCRAYFFRGDALNATFLILFLFYLTGMSGEEYLTATTTHAHTIQPGLYPSTSRTAIFSQAQQIRAAAAAAAVVATATASSIGSGGSGANSNNDSQASSSGGHSSSLPPPPPPAPPAPTPVMPPTPVLYSIHVPEERIRCVRHSGGGGGELPPKYEEVCFDV